jgi:hypothetical protein
VETRISSASAVQEESSPQSSAYVWLLTVDEVVDFSGSMREDEISVMTDKYILDVIFFSLGGENW